MLARRLKPRPSITKTPDKRPVFAGMLAKRVVVSVDGSADGGRHPPLRSDVTWGHIWGQGLLTWCRRRPWWRFNFHPEISCDIVWRGEFRRPPEAILLRGIIWQPPGAPEKKSVKTRDPAGSAILKGIVADTTRCTGRSYKRLPKIVEQI